MGFLAGDGMSDVIPVFNGCRPPATGAHGNWVRCPRVQSTAGRIKQGLPFPHDPANRPLHLASSVLSYRQPDHGVLGTVSPRSTYR